MNIISMRYRARNFTLSGCLAKEIISSTTVEKYLQLANAQGPVTSLEAWPSFNNIIESQRDPLRLGTSSV